MSSADVAGPDACVVDTEASLVTVRSRVRDRAVAVGFGIVDQTKLVTAASELARNILRYAGTGMVYIQSIGADPAPGEHRAGVQVRFEDRGPGIADVEAAMTDGWSTAGSLGFGLPGAKRLVDDFVIDSTPGEGTAVTITAWLR